jgi:YHS domain-containing protein
MTSDPVCKMNLDPEKAAAKAEYAGQTYYFCSEACHRSFTADPLKYAGTTAHGGQGHGGHH